MGTSSGRSRPRLALLFGRMPGIAAGGVLCVGARFLGGMMILPKEPNETSKITNNTLTDCFATVTNTTNNR